MKFRLKCCSLVSLMPKRFLCIGGPLDGEYHSIQDPVLWAAGYIQYNHAGGRGGHPSAVLLYVKLLHPIS